MAFDTIFDTLIKDLPILGQKYEKLSKENQAEIQQVLDGEDP